MTPKPKVPDRPIDADLYYALMFSALAFGGVGGGMAEDFDGPLCIIGLERAALNHVGADPDFPMRPLGRAFGGAPMTRNDEAVEAYNKAHRRPRGARIPWSAYVTLTGLRPKEDA